MSAPDRTPTVGPITAETPKVETTRATTELERDEVWASIQRGIEQARQGEGEEVEP